MVDARVGGFLLYQKLAAGEAEILNLAVDPDSRRQGLGSALLGQLITDAPGLISLEVRESNAPARALYAEFEFHEVGRRRAYYHRPVEDAIVLRRGSVSEESDLRAGLK